MERTRREEVAETRIIEKRVLFLTFENCSWFFAARAFADTTILSPDAILP